jgi:GT2 family glycosyltransferase
MAPAPPDLSLTIISHAQLPLVERALTSLARTPPRLPFEIVLLEDTGPPPGPVEILGGMPVRMLHNLAPAGLAYNLNRAFEETRGGLVCIVNPDVVFLEDVISPLADLVRRGEADIAAPTIVDSRGRVLESARAVPRPLELVARRLAPGRSASADPSADDTGPAWLAGTFLLLRRETFQALAGFDERYHLYFEDVDFGCRARLAGFRLLRSPGLRLQHEPAHRSRSHPRYFAWHVASALRFFTSPTYRAALQWERAERAQGARA